MVRQEEHREEAMSLQSTLKLPREHGAWVMFYASFILGCLLDRHGPHFQDGHVAEGFLESCST